MLRQLDPAVKMEAKVAAEVVKVAAQKAAADGERATRQAALAAAAKEAEQTVAADAEDAAAAAAEAEAKAAERNAKREKAAMVPGWHLNTTADVVARVLLTGATLN